MSLKVYFDKDAELDNYLKVLVTNINDPYGIPHIVIDETDILVNQSNFLSRYFNTLMAILPGLYSGDEKECPFEYVTLNFKPLGPNLTLYITSSIQYLNTPDKRYTTNLKEFAREVIKTTQEYLEYVLEKRPDLKDQKLTKEFIAGIKKTEEWYEQTYKEKV